MLNQENNKISINNLCGAVIAVIAAMIFILLFAFIIRLTNLNDNIIKPVNQIIKTLSIIIGCRFCIKHCKQNPIVLGIITGISFTIIAFVVFSILNNSFVFDKTLFNDCIFSTICGAICGVIFSKSSLAIK